MEQALRQDSPVEASDETVDATPPPERSSAPGAYRSRAEAVRLLVLIDGLIAEQLDQVLHHPRLQQLEALWRGAAWLADTMAGDRQLKLRILDVRWPELARDMDRAMLFDQTVLFDKIYNDEFGRPGGEPFGMIVVDHQIWHRPSGREKVDDVAVISGLAEVGAAAFCPIVLGVDPRTLGLDGFDELDLRQDITGTFQGREFMRLQRLRTQLDCRFIICALPRILMRAPYRGRSFPRIGFRYDEEVTSHSDMLWGSAGFGLANVAARAMRLHRWPANIRGAPGPSNGGIVEGPARTFAQSDRTGVVARFPTENAISESQELELNLFGLTALRQCHLTGSAAFFNVPSLHQPPLYDKEAARMNARMSAMTNYVMCVCRFAHYIKVIAREWVGRFKTADECQRVLDSWIREYVISSDDADADQRARYPLREAMIQVTEREDAPGSFDATVALRPHYQLDSITSDFQLTTDIGRTLTR